MVAVDVFDVIAIQRPEVVARRGHCGSPSVGPQAAWPSIGSSAETVRCLIPTIDARAIDSPMTRTAPVSIKQEAFIQSVADALHNISYYHPVDYIRNLSAAYEREEKIERDNVGTPVTNAHFVCRLLI